MKAAVALLAPVLIGGIAAAPEECDYVADRSAVVPAADATRIRINAAAGSLRVEGRPDLAEVRVRGRACASDEELLPAIRLTAGRNGAEVQVQVELPETNGGFFRDDYARLDLVVEVPAGMDATVEDSSGELEMRNTGAVDVRDGSGELTVEQATGQVRIDDGSGEIILFGIAGDVVVADGSGDVEADDVRGGLTIEDSSGGIDVRGVTGSVTLTDSSGGIEIATVGGSVLVLDDGSGGIRVEDVQGDFTVEDDGSGDLSWDGVQGQVRVPTSAWSWAPTAAASRVAGRRR